MKHARSAVTLGSVSLLALLAGGCTTTGAGGATGAGDTAATTLAPTTTVRIPGESGLLFFPFTWTVSIDGPAVSTLGAKLDSLQLRNLLLVLRNTRTKASAPLRLPVLTDDASEGGSRAVLEGSRPSVTFALPYFLPVGEGDYVVEALQATYVDPASGRTSDLQFPVENPFQMPSGRPPLPLQVRVASIAALPRMAAVTTFGVKDGGLVSLTEIENVDKEVVPVELVLSAGRLPPGAASKIYAASPDFPRARVSLLDAQGKPTPPEDAVARVGLLVDVPCDAGGHLNLVWKRVSDDREYFSAVPVSDSGGACEQTRTVSATLQLPTGEWVLRATRIVTEAKAASPYKLSVLTKPAPALERYLFLRSRRDIYAGISLEKELKRQMVVRLGEPAGKLSVESVSNPNFTPRTPPATDAVLFLGRFELVPVEAQRAEVWDTVFKRTFAIDALKSAFGARTIYNAYTGRVLDKGREKGTVQGVLRVASSQSDAKKLESATAEFRKGATEMVAACVTEREEVDPLIVVEGEGVFHGLKGGASVTIKQMTVSDEGASSQWVRDCLQKKLIDFRFGRKLPASFQAEFKFVSE